MAPWIENISLFDVRTGNHYDPGAGSVLIQITDPGATAPTPAWSFHQKHHFEFLDADGGFPDEALISQEQSEKIAKILISARNNNQNVVVHCHAGLCRSGAVSEVAISELGFRDVGRIRMPNVRVKIWLTSAIRKISASQ